MTTLNTPAGTPARSASSASASAENGVCDAGFSTTVQPAASAGPALRVIIASGKFHGVMHGDDADRLLDDDDALVGLVRGDRVAVDALGFFAEPLEERRRHRATSPRDSASGLPCSTVIRRARSSWCSTISSNQRRRTAARSLPVFLLPGRGNARVGGVDRLAASRPRRVLGTVPMISPVAGLSTAIVPPDRASTHSPSM